MDHSAESVLYAWLREEDHFAESSYLLRSRSTPGKGTLRLVNFNFEELGNLEPHSKIHFCDEGPRLR
jgi:hypothetical protein